MIRLKLLSAGKLAALAVFLTVAVVLTVYLTLRQKRVESDPARPKLQGRVVAVFNNTRYAHEVGGRVRFVLTAGTDKTYEDGTHELEQVRLESFGAEGTRHDTVTSDQAKVSDPANLNSLDAEFISNVIVQLTDGLTIKTSYLHYDQAKNVVETKEVVNFDGPTLVGRTTGLLIEVANERAHLLKDVDLTIKPGDGKSSKDAAARPDQAPAERAARKERKRQKKLARKKAKAEGALSGSNGSKPDRGKQNKPRAADSELTAKAPTRIRANSALLEKQAGRVSFDGGVIITQRADEMRSDHMVGFISDAKQIERIEARGNSLLKQADDSEIKSTDMDFFFGEARQLERALATGSAYARSLGSAPLREARADSIEAVFIPGPEGSAVDTIKAVGNARVHVHAPPPANEKDNPASRELSAGQIDLGFYPDGKNIKSARAVENAVMIVTPVRAELRADRKTIRAPRMTADFYAEGNRVNGFNASEGVRVEIEPTVAGAYPPRVTTSRELAATFARDSQDVLSLNQEGDFKYNEGDRNAEAERASYDGQKEILSLRGHRPMAWDAKARTQADEIDYHRQVEQTFARGDVRTTYYSRESANNATPFKKTKSPVFITGARAELRSRDGVAIYTENARGWQDDNFVKADRIELYEKDKRMVATGNVESTLYSIKQGEGGKRENVPGFASAERMTYSDTDRLVHYDGAVKARQGTDRIDASAIDVFLKKETNEVDRMTAEGNVVLVQPGRRGVGDKFAYTSDDGRSVLAGKTARVEDREKGTTMGSQLTFYSRDDKVLVENQQGTGRVRSTHRLTKNREN